jgi:hypothetical protein
MLSSLLLVLALVARAVVRPLKRAWTWIGLPLGCVMTAIIAGALFYLIVTPLGWLVRALSKDPMQLRRDPLLNTYWLPRVPGSLGAEMLKRQF